MVLVFVVVAEDDGGGDGGSDSGDSGWWVVGVMGCDSCSGGEDAMVRVYGVVAKGGGSGIGGSFNGVRIWGGGWLELWLTVLSVWRWCWWKWLWWWWWWVVDIVSGDDTGCNAGHHLRIAEGWRSADLIADFTCSCVVSTGLLVFVLVGGWM